MKPMIFLMLLFVLLTGCGGQESGPTRRVSANPTTISLGRESVISVDFTVSGAPGFYDSTSINVAIPSNLRLKTGTVELQESNDSDYLLREITRVCPDWDGEVFEFPISSDDLNSQTVRELDEAQIRFVVAGVEVGNGQIKAFQGESFPACSEITNSSSSELITVRN